MINKANKMTPTEIAEEKSRNFRIRVQKNPFMKAFKLAQENHTCYFCNRKISDGRFILHHLQYNHKCVTPNIVCIGAYSGTKPYRANKVPDCEKCYRICNNKFLKCASLLRVTHGLCHAGYHIQKRIEINIGPMLEKTDNNWLFKEPSSLSDEDIIYILEKAKSLLDWLEDVKNYALQQALKGKKYDGWKVVAKYTGRRYTDKKAVAQAVMEAGYNPFEIKLLGIKAMTTQLGGDDNFYKILGELVEKPIGAPTLVKMADRRPEIR